MRLGLSCYSFPLACGLGETSPARRAVVSARVLLGKARSLDLQGVQLLGRRQADNRDFTGLVALRQEAEEAGLFLELAASGFQPESVKTMVRTASVLGSAVLSLRLGIDRPASRAEIESRLRQAAESLRRVLPTCEKYGVGIALQNNMDFTSRELLQLLERLDSEWVGICFDTGSQLAVLEDPETALVALAPYVYNVHLSDWQVAAAADGLRLCGCALGDGVVDLPALLKRAKVHSLEVSVHVASRPEEKDLPVLLPSFLGRFYDRQIEDLAALFRRLWERNWGQPPSAGATPDLDPERREESIAARSVPHLSRLMEEVGLRATAAQEPR